jgi:hypothetical protein
MKKNQVENPSVKKDFSEEFTKLSEHARAEISWVRSAYKFAFGFIILGVTILLGLGIYFTYQNTHDLKADMQKDADNMRASIHTDFEAFKQKQQQDQSSYLRRMISSKASCHFRVAPLASATNKCVRAIEI